MYWTGLMTRKTNKERGGGMMSAVEILKSFGICFLSAIPIWLYCAFFMLLA